jgi:hypothetical protein
VDGHKLALASSAYSPNVREVAFPEFRSLKFPRKLADGRMRRDLAWCKLTIEEIATLGGSRDRRY